MSDEEAFYAAMKANPLDDTPFLVYADWLDDHDRPNEAAFVRAVTYAHRLDTNTREYTELFAEACRLAELVDQAWRERFVSIRRDIPTPAPPLKDVGPREPYDWLPKHQRPDDWRAKAKKLWNWFYNGYYQ